MAARITGCCRAVSNGAEQLQGRGDMLFLPPASRECIRLQGAWVSEGERARIAAFLRGQGQPAYDPAVTAGTEDRQRGIEKDALYDEAARL